VDIYLVDPHKSPEIATLLQDMEKQAPSGNDQHAAEVFFASYQRLASTIKKTSMCNPTTLVGFRLMA
jgi:hypothetical protein